MAIGGPVKKIVPYFNGNTIEDVDLNLIGVDGFSTDANKYFLIREEELSFDSAGYLDVLNASGFVVKKAYDTQFSYNQSLAELFFRLFPAPQDYEKSLKSWFPRLKDQLSILKVCSPDIGEVRQSLIKLQQENRASKEFMQTVKITSLHHEYVSTSLSYLKEIGEFLLILLTEVDTTPAEIISYNYYSRIPHLSWLEDPLAFFRSLIFSNGIQRLEEDLAYNQLVHSNYESISDYVEQACHTERVKSLKLIQRKVASFGKKTHLKRLYLKKVCTYIDVLYLYSNKGEIKKIYPACFTLFQRLSRDLKSLYGKKFKIITHVKDEEYVYPNGFNREVFAKKLTSLKLLDNSKEGIERNICYDKNSKNLELFIQGKFKEIEKLTFDWTTYQIYYLIYKLVEYNFFNAKFFIDKRSNISDKIFVGNKAFSQKSYSWYISRIENNKEKLPKGSAAIDRLFR